MNPSDLKYSKEHEWVRLEGDTAVVGVTDFAQEQLGDVVFLEIQIGEGDALSSGDTFGEIESVKSVSELYSPLTGEVVSVNDALTEESETVNSDPYGDGWMIKVRMDDPSEVDGLLSAEEYEAFISEGA
jgi:glycine cleavage system H protein